MHQNSMTSFMDRFGMEPLPMLELEITVILFSFTKV